MRFDRIMNLTQLWTVPVMCEIPPADGSMDVPISHKGSSLLHALQQEIRPYLPVPLTRPSCPGAQETSLSAESPTSGCDLSNLHARRPVGSGQISWPQAEPMIISLTVDQLGVQGTGIRTADHIILALRFSHDFLDSGRQFMRGYILATGYANGAVEAPAVVETLQPLRGERHLF